jgi:prepilin-type N-terminal cleavage/methylation domain-containing protein
MNTARVIRKQRGFTLIELLVVIAIIAILAAILFPVFAQAKTSAKKTVLISNAKQHGLAALMYAGDYNDLFPLAYRGDHPDYWVQHDWGVLVLPYIKNVGLYMDSFSPASINDNPFIINSQWTMPARRDASVWCEGEDVCAFGIYNPRTGEEITNGEIWYRGGVGGAGTSYDGSGWPNDPWHAWGLDTSTPSLSNSQVSRIAETLLIAQSNMMGFQWHQNWNPDEAFRYYGDANFNLMGDQNCITGPAARVNASGEESGCYPTSIASLEVWPTGQNVAVFADGHAESNSWLQLHSEYVEAGNGERWLAYAAPTID